MRGVIFDLDGTLVDSLRDIAEAMERTLAALGLPSHPLASYERFIGDGARMLVRRAIGEANAAREDEALERYRAEYETNLVVHTRAYDGIAPALEALAHARVPTSVLSNKQHAFTQEIVRRLFPRHAFVAVAGQVGSPGTELEFAL